jgi:hypothetical protein
LHRDLKISVQRWVGYQQVNHGGCSEAGLESDEWLGFRSSMLVRDT